MLPNDNNHIELETTNFQTLLSTDDNNLQQALETLDKHTHTGGGGTWGSITGTLSSQTDLQAALNALTSAIAAKQAALGFKPRTTLSAAATYYVRTDGNDANTGLVNSSGGAFLTIQYAIDVASALDNMGYNITIQVVDGTYSLSSPILCKTFVGSGTITLQGNVTTPNNCVLSYSFASSNDGIQASGVLGVYNIQGFKMICSSNGNQAIYAVDQSIVNVQKMNFSTGWAYHLSSTSFAEINIIGNYTISGGAAMHFTTSQGKIGANVTLTITVSGTPAFSSAFANASRCGYILVTSSKVTFSGSATGKYYSAALNAVIDTLGGGGTYFPGNSAGSTPTGGQYA